MKQHTKIIISSIIIIISIILKITLVQSQPLNIRYTMRYDDALIADMANNIIQGKWLGDYSSFTLVKGIFTPLFLILTYILNIPFLLGKEIFYIISCLILILVLSKKIKQWYLLVGIFIIFIFNPIEYSTQMSRIYRDEIYISLIIFMLSFSLGIFFNRKENIKKQLKYFIGLGFTLSAILLCREDNIWIMPFVVFMSSVTLFCIFKDNNLKFKIRRCSLYIIPISITLILSNLVCFINYKHYGVYTLNQYWGHSFKMAYGALTRIKPDEEKRRVPVTSDVLNKLYSISPKAAELKPFFESAEGKNWQLIDERIPNEINGCYFHWALMAAVENAGYYKNAETSNKYYEDLANEINTAIDKGLLEARCPKRISNACYFNFNDLIDVIKQIPHVMNFEFTFKDVHMKTYNSLHLNIMLSQKEEMINLSHQNIEGDDFYNNNYNKFILRTSKNVLNIYSFINPIIFYIGIFCFIFLVVFALINFKQYYEIIVILISLALLYSGRIFVLSFTSTLMFNWALNVSYMSSVYNIQILFSILSISTTINVVFEQIKKLREPKIYEIELT